MSEDIQNRLEAKHQGHEMSPELANVAFSCLSGIFLRSVKIDGYLRGLRERGITPAIFRNITIRFSPVLERRQNDDPAKSSELDIIVDKTRRYSLEANFIYNGREDFEPLDFVLSDLTARNGVGEGVKEILRARIDDTGAKAMIYDGRSEEEVVLELFDNRESLMNT